MPSRAEGVAAGSRGGERSEHDPVRCRSQGGSREKSVVRWSGATSRQRQRFERETQDRQRRAMRERSGGNGGSGQRVSARWTHRAQCLDAACGGKAAGLKAKHPLPQNWSVATPEAGDAEAESGQGH